MKSTRDMGPAAATLWSAWNSLPKRGHVPARGDFDPMAVPSILPVTALLETGGTEGRGFKTNSLREWRVRLVGTEIDRRNGFSLFGQDYIDYVAPGARAFYVGIFGEVVNHPCGSWEIRRIARASGAIATVEVLRLPLRAADGRVRLMISTNEDVVLHHQADADSGLTVLLPQQHRLIDLGAGVPSRASEAAGRPAEPGHASMPPRHRALRAGALAAPGLLPNGLGSASAT